MPFPNFLLDSKIALVTGGDSGINLSFSKLDMQHGAQVLIADLKLVTDVSEFAQSAKGAFVFAKCDVTKRADLEKLVEISVKE